MVQERLSKPKDDNDMKRDGRPSVVRTPFISVGGVCSPMGPREVRRIRGGQAKLKSKVVPNRDRGN